MLGRESDDIDILFRSPTGNPVAYLERVAQSRGWPCKKKTDEKTGEARWDFIAIGDASKKDKFSGHPIGSGCEGDFACNTLLYDVATGSLIDPSGFGIDDSINFRLRIPYPPAYWETWLRSDRLLGMRLLRYYNFCSRGYVAASDDLRKWIVETTKKLFDEETDDISRTVLVFLKRKVLKSSVDVAVKKQRAWRESIVREFVAASGSSTPIEKQRVEAGARAWVRANIVPLFPRVQSSVDGVHAALARLVEEEDRSDTPPLRPAPEPASGAPVNDLRLRASLPFELKPATYIREDGVSCLRIGRRCANVGVTCSAAFGCVCVCVLLCFRFPLCAQH